MLKIRTIEARDYDQWLPLWLAYLKFYAVELDESTTQGTWDRLIEASEIRGFVAEHNEAIIGFVHYLFHANTWSMKPVCYLEDLFVADAVRGIGAGRKLIEAVYAAAGTVDAVRTYWVTNEENTNARALYEKLATRMSVVQYRG
jgi:GNAT superfamily N-acetyltransferase